MRPLGVVIIYTYGNDLTVQVKKLFLSGLMIIKLFYRIYDCIYYFLFFKPTQIQLIGSILIINHVKNN